MAKKFLGILSLSLMMACQTQLTEGAFFTEGNCEACAVRIEQALKDHPGVEQMKWDQENQMTLVLYNARETTLDAIQQKVADAGFTTQYFDGNPASRDTLIECCKQAGPKINGTHSHP